MKGDTFMKKRSTTVLFSSFIFAAALTVHAEEHLIGLNKAVQANQAVMTAESISVITRLTDSYSFSLR